MEFINYDQFISVQTEYMWKAHIKSIKEDEGLEVTEISRTYCCENRKQKMFKAAKRKVEEEAMVVVKEEEEEEEENTQYL
jgi:hypothetical protein